MNVVRRMIVGTCRACMRFARWSLATVEDEPAPNVIQLPGPAHGPVPAIEMRLEGQRRRAS